MGPELTRRHLLATGAAVAGTAALTGPLSSPASATDRPTARTKPTVVLVHGGFADASCWNGVIEQLQHAGYPTLAPANPLRSLPTDAAYLASVLQSVSGPIVLVGHSYGGGVITNAAVGIPGVKALVYIAAFVPDKGEQLGVLINKYPGSIIQAATRPVPYPNPDGTTGTDLYLEADKFRVAFAADLPVATTRLMQATQRPFSAACFTDATTAAAWRTLPTWGLVAGADKAIPPALERFFYERASARKVVEIPGASHVAMTSHPGITARLVEAAADATG
ncbi:alpha/beta fold hydrolase [Streptomyces chiangmaiensis]|uniref:Alpha/beta hydrolase n=1 Tax=Streptomyces chiangmaiensis TaxID=766497 RepID=A0ABU7FLJ6_9ACTN|nr:alpha/beta hydrolase [Streptomyces chiangmaiensis]MED7825000.1 alpha/beta hydrolase [Streptomyces chiangmaiensis]